MPKIAMKRNITVGAAGGGAKKAASVAKKSKLYNMPEKVKEGTVLRDLMKTEWKIGPSIGTGGFGEIYSASKSGEDKYQYVVKCEPHDNGPLFVEMHFYMRNAKLDDIRNFQRERGLKSLGMPYMIGNGSAEINGVKHRFIVMPRYGSDLAKYFLMNGRKLPEGTCYRLVLQMLDVYEFIHGCGYVHADLKAANILMGYGKQHQHQAYLVDFGLASHYTIKDYKPDPKKMHNGTIEYTSRDAHNGVPTMRADLEILGYNLIEWLGIELPWVKDKLLTSPVKVQKAKEEFMSDVVINLKKLSTRSIPTVLMEFFRYISRMEYNETPDYEGCRKMFRTALKRLKVPLTGDLDFKLKAPSVNNNSSPSTSRMSKVTTKKVIKQESCVSEPESEDEVMKNASDDDDDDVVFPNNKKIIKNETKRPLKTSAKLTPKQKILANSSLKRTKTESTNDAEFPPSSAKRNKLNARKSPTKVKTSPLKQNTSHSNTSLTTSGTKSKHSPLNAKANIRMSPAVTISSSRSGRTIINDRVTPNKKPTKTYEFNFELDVSMDANVIVNVKRKKKALQPSQEKQSSSIRNTPSGSVSNTTPVTRVKVRKVGNSDDGSRSPRTPVVTVKKARRLQQTLS